MPDAISKLDHLAPLDLSALLLWLPSTLCNYPDHKWTFGAQRTYHLLYSQREIYQSFDDEKWLQLKWRPRNLYISGQFELTFSGGYRSMANFKFLGVDPRPNYNNLRSWEIIGKATNSLRREATKYRLKVNRTIVLTQPQSREYESESFPLQERRR